MPILPTYNHCCGCSACYAACPHNSITMCPDSEGFLYPDINSTTCTECKICEQVCPTLPYLDFAPYTLVRKRSTFPYNPKISCAQRINHTISNQAATKSFSLTKRERENRVQILRIVLLLQMWLFWAILPQTLPFQTPHAIALQSKPKIRICALTPHLEGFLAFQQRLAYNKVALYLALGLMRVCVQCIKEQNLAQANPAQKNQNPSKTQNPNQIPKKTQNLTKQHKTSQIFYGAPNMYNQTRMRALSRLKHCCNRGARYFLAVYNAKFKGFQPISKNLMKTSLPARLFATPCQAPRYGKSTNKAYLKRQEKSLQILTLEAKIMAGSTEHLP